MPYYDGRNKKKIIESQMEGIVREIFIRISKQCRIKKKVLFKKPG